MAAGFRAGGRVCKPAEVVLGEHGGPAPRGHSSVLRGRVVWDGGSCVGLTDISAPSVAR